MSCIIRQIFKSGGSGNEKSKAKYATLAGVVLSAGILLSACGNSSTASKTYNYVYSSDPSSLNYLAENRATTNDIVTNLVDGLMENDQYGNYVHLWQRIGVFLKTV